MREPVKDYYIEKDTTIWLEGFIDRIKKKWDNLLLIDGMERSGKTTLAVTLSYYLANKMNKKFTVDNIFFDPEKMIKFATTTREQIIMWDEAAFGGLSSQWHNKVQQKLRIMLMVAGKYNHTYFFIIPSFFELQKYIAVTRSMGLINVTTPDMIQRGFYTVYNRNQKTFIYNHYTKTQWYGHDRCFRGRWLMKNVDKIIDWDIYEDKKDKAIQHALQEDTGGRKGDMTKLEKIQNALALNYPEKDVIKITGCHRRTYYEWKNRAQVAL